MEWNMWLDDCRNPSAYGGTDCIWARDVEQAQYYVRVWGPPTRMYLDHDLGESENVMEFLRWLSNEHFDSCPEYSCHSDNPVGKQNINSFMSSWKKILGK